MHDITPVATWLPDVISVPDGPDPISPLHVEQPIQVLANQVTYVRDEVVAVDERLSLLTQSANFELIQNAALVTGTGEHFQFNPYSCSWAQSEGPSTLWFGLPGLQRVQSVGGILGKLWRITLKYRPASDHTLTPQYFPGIHFHYRRSAGANVQLEVFDYVTSLAEYESGAIRELIFYIPEEHQTLYDDGRYFIGVSGEAGTHAIFLCEFLSLVASVIPP